MRVRVADLWNAASKKKSFSTPTKRMKYKKPWQQFPRYTDPQMCTPTPTSFYSSNPVQQAHWGTHAYMLTCTLIPTGLYRHVTNQGYRWIRWTPRVRGHTGCMSVCVAVAFSWSRRRRAAQRPQAPCRRGRWRTSSASRLYSPRGRCACRAGTGWGLHKQSPSYKWRICAGEDRRSSP